VRGFFGFICAFSQGGEPSHSTSQGRVCHWDFVDSRIKFVDLALEFVVNFTVKYSKLEKFYIFKIEGKNPTSILVLDFRQTVGMLGLYLWL
jgi:hypothetical protein